jgi:YebC/PmpR family DNA-binding regulatory protein
MAGHSKWANIKHRKAAADAKKGKVFTRLIKEITVAAKHGGGDPDSNPKLRLMLDKARDANMTKDSVTRAVQRGTGELEGVSYEEARYEGYGPGGAAVMVDCLTDNRTRTIAEVRHAFSKNGGNIGADGSVAFLFKHCGQFVFAPGANEEKVMEAALDAGAEDVGRTRQLVEVLSRRPISTRSRPRWKGRLKPDAAELTRSPCRNGARQRRKNAHLLRWRQTSGH